MTKIIAGWMKMFSLVEIGLLVLIALGGGLWLNAEFNIAEVRDEVGCDSPARWCRADMQEWARLCHGKPPDAHPGCLDPYKLPGYLKKLQRRTGL